MGKGRGRQGKKGEGKEGRKGGEVSGFFFCASMYSQLVRCVAVSAWGRMPPTS